ncbi:Oxidoreductase family, NAD-binding Rossmann fold [Gimesia alba]|uniref:Oxidoreductase family, NAD-binding Rossmann fold n=1 Tax=Gimesia alba TaxID=2527973 RepID=A0A517RNU1_9PLAN|nr:family 16 glycoside hydrolase [Gimesia alba]QDT45502.1 Oxidoreductase family, NAD-binding Rossmann fold [Gimesia alba]
MNSGPLKRLFCQATLLLFVLTVALTGPLMAWESKQELRAGIIGLDTSHAIAFTKMLNTGKPEGDLAGIRVVAAYPQGSKDIESSVSRVPGYTKQVKEMGVEIVDSIDELLKKVDVVFLETNDGRPHLEQAIPVFQAGKPVFIDKPIAGSLTDAVALFELSRKYNTPMFSSSSLRFSKGAQRLRNGEEGKITKCSTHSPCSLEPTHPDLFWYGIHGVETLFTVMGPGCQTAKRTVSNADRDEVVGKWSGGREGQFSGVRKGTPKGYGGTAVGKNGEVAVGGYDGYKPLLVEIAKFFRTGKAPVSEEETLEIYSFMEAADESKRQGGAEVSLASVLKKAKKAAHEKLAKLDLADSGSAADENKLTAAEKAAGWKLLFNGKNYQGWKCSNGKSIAAPIEDGALVPYKSGGYLIVYDKPFSDFEFKCDVKMPEECNSGIFFRVGDLKDPVQTGFEAQVLSGKGTGMHDFGAIYDLVAPAANQASAPGEWTNIEITCKGPHVSVAVNGKVVAKLNADEWTEPGKRLDGSKHKFKAAVKDFPRKGYIGFQDHGHKVWYKNVKLLEL